MNKISLSLTGVALTVAMLLLTPLASPIPALAKARAKTYKTVYTCRMHPEVRSSKPGKCPKCGMKLTKKK